MMSGVRGGDSATVHQRLSGPKMGLVVDAMHAPAISTVAFFRDGKTVALADVTPDP